MLEVTALLPSSSVPSVSFVVSFPVVSKAALGLSCAPCAQIPDNLCVGACFLVFVHKAPFPRPLMTMSPEVLNLTKSRLDLLLPKLTEAGECCGYGVR